MPRPKELTFTKKQPEIWLIASNFQLLQSSSFSRSTKPKAPTISDQLTWAPGCNRGSHEGPSSWGFLIRKKCVCLFVVILGGWHPGILASWVRLSEHNQHFQSIQSSTSSSTIFFGPTKKNPLLKRKWLRGAGAFCSTSTVPSGSSCCKCTWTNWEGCRKPRNWGLVFWKATKMRRKFGKPNFMTPSYSWKYTETKALKTGNGREDWQKTNWHVWGSILNPWNVRKALHVDVVGCYRILNYPIRCM